MKYEFAYSEFKAPISVSVAGTDKPIAEYSYKNNSGRLKKISYADGETVDVVYSNLGLVVSETVKNSSGDVIAKRKYDYDLQGNVARCERYRGTCDLYIFYADCGIIF